ncbi:hypothetical protein AHF37_10084 [Paragonimus kellicotti]|nr:hypothetical protein AHF37_10084 [Paragonimus kellicotti]
MLLALLAKGIASNYIFLNALHSVCSLLRTAIDCTPPKRPFVHPYNASNGTSPPIRPNASCPVPLKWDLLVSRPSAGAVYS